MVPLTKSIDEIEFWVRRRVIPWIQREGINRLVFCNPPIKRDELPKDVLVLGYREPRHSPSIQRRAWEISRIWRQERLCSFRFPHLAYVLEGAAEIRLGSVVLRIPSDTLLLIPPHVPIDDDQPHLRFLSSRVDALVKVVWFLVAPSLVRIHVCFSDASRHFYTPLKFFLAPGVYPLVLALIEELQQKREGYREVATSYLTAIFWQILRAVKEIPLPAPCASAMVKVFPEVSESSLSGQICRLVLQTFPHTPSIKMLADLFGMSPSHLRYLFRRQTGQSLQDYLRSLKLRVAKILLRQTDFPVTLIAQILGFQDPLYFSRWFKKASGFAPSEVRRSTPTSEA